MVSSYEKDNKITTIITDNASNMTKSFNFLHAYADDDASDDTDLEPVDRCQPEYRLQIPQQSACYAHTL